MHVFMRAWLICATVRNESHLTPVRPLIRTATQPLEPGIHISVSSEMADDEMS